MYSASRLEARELGAAFSEPCPKYPCCCIVEADVLCLHTAATFVSSLCLLSPHARPRPAVTPFILPLEPQGQVCFKLLENRVGLDLEHTVLSLSVSPAPEGKGEHRAAEAWIRFSHCPERSPRPQGALSLVKGGERCHSFPRVWWGLPHLASPLCKPSLPTLSLINPTWERDPAWERGMRRN